MTNHPGREKHFSHVALISHFLLNNDSKKLLVKETRLTGVVVVGGVVQRSQIQYLCCLDMNWSK